MIKAAFDILSPFRFSAGRMSVDWGVGGVRPVLRLRKEYHGFINTVLTAQGKWQKVRENTGNLEILLQDTEIGTGKICSEMGKHREFQNTI